MKRDVIDSLMAITSGKISVLDAIAWVLGGDRYRPSGAKNSDLKVTDSNGQKAGQQLLNEFVETLALDLPKFMESSSKEKANTLLKIIGIGDNKKPLSRPMCPEAIQISCIIRSILRYKGQPSLTAKTASYEWRRSFGRTQGQCRKIENRCGGMDEYNSNADATDYSV